MSNSAPTREQSGVTFSGIDSNIRIESTTPVILKSEYLTGGYPVGGDALSILTHNKDVWAGELTDSIIAEMLKDSEIYKCLTVIKNGVLDSGVLISPSINQPTAIKPPAPGEIEDPERKRERLSREKEIERYNLSKSYAEFMTRAFDNLEVPLPEVLDDMMDALAYGNKVAEKVFVSKMDKEFKKELFYLKRLNVKPRKSTIFVVDKFKNLIGLKAWKKVKDEDGNETLKEVVIKKEKFAVLTFGSKDNDPRGTSFLESAYRPWHLKTQLWPEYLRWLIYSSVPPIVGYTSNETDSRKVLRDVNGDLVTDSDGNPVFESDVGALLKALAQVRNASAIALPYGAKVETLNSSVSGDPFKGFRDVLNQEIEMGLILQTLATSDSRHNTRAASQTHITILDDLVWKVKGTVTALISNIVKHLMDINFADYDETLVPIVSMGDSARREFAGDVGAVSQLSISGFIGESQKPGLDRLLGLPPRDIYSDREFEKEQALEKLMLAERAKQLVVGSQPAPDATQTAQPSQPTQPSQGQPTKTVSKVTKQNTTNGVKK